MKKTLLSLAALALLAGACKKEDSTKPATNTSSNNSSSGTGTGSTGGGTTQPTVTTGTVRFISTSNNPYKCSINGDAQGNCEGKGMLEITKVPEGYLTCKVEQLSGYVAYPTVKEYTGRLVAGGTLEVRFPD